MLLEITAAAAAQMELRAAEQTLWLRFSVHGATTIITNTPR